MLELTVRLVASLAVIVGLLLLMTKLAARRFRGGTGAVLQVVHRQALSRSSHLVVVTVGGRVLVLGATEHQINVLAELEPEELELAEGAAMRVSDPDDEDTTGDGGSQERPPAGVISTSSSPSTSRVAGSVLSAQTWKQAFAAATRRRS